MIDRPAVRPRRRRAIDTIGAVVVVAAYLMLATRGEVVSWLWR